jgi:hypothetical protein
MNRQAEEQAAMAEELHAKMFQTEPTDAEDSNANQDYSQPNEETGEVPHDDDIEELRKFKARYLSLQGKYDAEVPRLHNELKEFKQTVFERLEQNLARQDQEQQSAAPEADPFEAEKELFGEDLHNYMLKLARYENEKLLNQKLKPVQQKVDDFEETQVNVAKQNFIADLDSKVKGDWKTLWEGKDPKFIEFLGQEDPSGLYTYEELLQAYNTKWDSDRMAKVFNTYLESSQPAQHRQRTTERTAMVAPSRQNSHAVPNTSQARIWTAETFKQFQDADRAGKYSAEESKALWDDLLSAPAQGRMRG